MNLKNNDLKEFMIFLSIILFIILAFSFVLFGVTGIRIVLGIIFISFPFYLILNNFKLTESEKFVFSILLGITVFPSLVYILGLLISFRISIAIVFILIVVIAFGLRRYKPKN